MILLLSNRGRYKTLFHQDSYPLEASKWEFNIKSLERSINNAKVFGDNTTFIMTCLLTSIARYNKSSLLKRNKFKKDFSDNIVMLISLKNRKEL